MRESGILFTPENIRLIRDSLKTQTRRVANTFGEGMHHGKKLCEWSLSSGPFCLTEEDFPVWRWRGAKPAKIGDWAQEIQTDVDDHCTFHIRNPYGAHGDRLYVKEGVILHGDGTPYPLKGYYMDGERATNLGEKRLTAMFMPKWAARTWLEITDVRVERLQEISEEDAKAEGCGNDDDPFWQPTYNDPDSGGYPSYKNSYHWLWDEINGKKYPWSQNPFVYAITFKKINREEKQACQQARFSAQTTVITSA